MSAVASSISARSCSSGASNAKLHLAELLWEEPSKRTEARALAQAAARELRARGHDPQARAAETWLAEHHMAEHEEEEMPVPRDAPRRR